MKVKDTSKVREQPAKDNYLARVVGVVNIGLQPGYVWQGEEIDPSNKVEVTFELVTTEMSDGRPFHVSKEFTNSKASKNTQALFTACNVDDMDWSLLVNRPCLVTVDQNDKGYSRVKNVAGVPSGIPVADLRNPSYVFDMEDENPDLKMFQSFSEFRRNKITSALNYGDTPLAKAIREDDDVPF